MARTSAVLSNMFNKLSFLISHCHCRHYLQKSVKVARSDFQELGRIVDSKQMEFTRTSQATYE